MEPNEVQSLIDSAIAKLESKIRKFLDDKLNELEVPDTRNLATKKLVNDVVQELRTQITEELSKTNTAVTKVAEEADVKIKELSTKKSDWTDIFKTVLDY
jgi:ribosome-associated translation inhibitor RaiA